MPRPRVINFNSGPAALPLPPLERAQRELLDYAGTGMSIMEHSHRGKTYEGVHKEAIALIRELTGLGDSHHVLFVQGGATQQFAVLPMNFLAPGVAADYVVTGHWSERAVEEAKLVAGIQGGEVRVAATTKEKEGVPFRRLPRPEELKIGADAAYVHITTNNTIYGTQWHAEPDVGGVPLVADMSSDILWRKQDLAKYALVYGGAQKNLGPSGVTVVIARKDFVDKARKDIPTIFRYEVFAKNESLYNTPPTFGVYLMRNVLLWIKESGGLAAMEQRNREKARLLYGAIDARPGFYRSVVDPAARSVMNVVFRLPSEALDAEFVAEAEKAGMVGLKGYRTTGGVRVSMYNAIGVPEIQTLVGFMDEFARKRG